MDMVVMCFEITLSIASSARMLRHYSLGLDSDPYVHRDGSGHSGKCRHGA
jgi:hypothetical protein